MCWPIILKCYVKIHFAHVLIVEIVYIVQILTTLMLILAITVFLKRKRIKLISFQFPTCKVFPPKGTVTNSQKQWALSLFFNKKILKKSPKVLSFFYTLKGKMIDLHETYFPL